MNYKKDGLRSEGGKEELKPQPIVLILKLLRLQQLKSSVSEKINIAPISVISPDFVLIFGRNLA